MYATEIERIEKELDALNKNTVLFDMPLTMERLNILLISMGNAAQDRVEQFVFYNAAEVMNRYITEKDRQKRIEQPEVTAA